MAEGCCLVQTIDDFSGVGPVVAGGGEVLVQADTGKQTLLHANASDLACDVWLQGKVRASEKVNTQELAELLVVVVPGDLDITSTIVASVPVLVLDFVQRSAFSSSDLDRKSVV